MAKVDKAMKEFNKGVYQIISKTYQAGLEDVSPVRTGELKRNWYIVNSAPWVWEVVNDTEYAKYVDEGTGLYGPKKKLIVPKKKKALAWGKTYGRSKSGAPMKEFVFRSVKGQHPQKMIQRVEQSKSIKKKFDREINKLLDKHWELTLS